MTTLGNVPSPEVRQVLRRMRRLALAFHGSELRLTDREGRRATVLCPAPARPQREKVGAQA